jgi:hypothetical protein
MWEFDMSLDVENVNLLLEEGLKRVEWDLPELPEMDLSDLSGEGRLMGEGSTFQEGSVILDLGRSELGWRGSRLELEGLAGAAILEGTDWAGHTYRVHGLVRSLDIAGAFETGQFALEFQKDRENRLQASLGPFALRWDGGSMVGQFDAEGSLSESATLPSLDVDLELEELLLRGDAFQGRFAGNLIAGLEVGQAGMEVRAALDFAESNLQLEALQLEGIAVEGPIIAQLVGLPQNRDEADLLGGVGEWIRGNQEWSGLETALSWRIDNWLYRKGEVELAGDAFGDLILTGSSRSLSPRLDFNLNSEFGIAGDFFLEGVDVSGGVWLDSVEANRSGNSLDLNELVESLVSPDRFLESGGGRLKATIEGVSQPGAWEVEAVELNLSTSDEGYAYHIGVQSVEYLSSQIGNVRGGGTFSEAGGSLGLKIDLGEESDASLAATFNRLPEVPETWAWKAEVPEAKLSESQVAGLFHPMLSGSRLSGQFQFSANGRFSDIRELDGQGVFSCRGGDLVLPGMELNIQGMETELSFTGLRQPATQRAQVARISLLEKGSLMATDIQGVFTLQPGGNLLVDGIEARVFGGSLRIGSFQFGTENPQLNLVIHLDSVELGEVQKLIKDFPGSMKGKIEGVIRLSWDGQNIGFGEGRLSLVPGTQGELRLSLDKRELKPGDPAYPFLENLSQSQAALESMRFIKVDEAVFTLFNTANVDNPNQLLVRGVSYSVEPSTPVNITVNLKEEVESVLNRFLKIALSLN